LAAIFKTDAAIAHELIEVWFIAGKISKCFGVLKGERQRFEGVIETEQMDGTGEVPGRPQNSEGIGGCPQADVPNDEFAGVVGQPFGQVDLADVKGLRFGHRADDRMEGLAMGERMDAMNAAG